MREYPSTLDVRDRTAELDSKDPKAQSLVPKNNKQAVGSLKQRIVPLSMW